MIRWQGSLVGLLFTCTFLNWGCANPAAQSQTELLARMDKMQAEIMELKQHQQFREFVQPSGGGAGGPSSLPSPPPLGAPDKSISDIACRRKLGFYDKTDSPIKLQKDVSEYGIAGAHAMPATTAEVWEGCQELLPITRLLFENAVAGASDSYTNLAGFPSVTSPIVRQSGNVYQIGIGYSQKPILKQLRRLIDGTYGNEPDPSITNQGSWAEDFIFNAILLNAGIGWGQSLNIKNGTATAAVYSRPTYSVGATYSLDLERTWIHLFHDSPLNPEGARPADPGYFYVPRTPGAFWPAQVF